MLLISSMIIADMIAATTSCLFVNDILLSSIDFLVLTLLLTDTPFEDLLEIFIIL